MRDQLASAQPLGSLEPLLHAQLFIKLALLVLQQQTTNVLPVTKQILIRTENREDDPCRYIVDLLEWIIYELSIRLR
jgi:hypothetical protein